MKQKIIARLKERFSGVNLSNKRLDAIADKLASKITDENQIDAKLDELNEVFSFADIAKEDDRVRTLEANQKPKPTKVEPEPKTDPVVSDDTPDWAKALIKQNETMSQKLELLESGRTQETHMARLVAVLKDKKVPEDYYSVAIAGRTFKDNDELDAFTNNLVTAYGKFSQDHTNAALKDQPAPVMGVVKDAATEVSPMMQQFIKSSKPAESQTKTA